MKLYSESFGAGPDILLCHGFGGSARNFRMQARMLGSHFRVTLFDLPGHARSPAPDAVEAYRLAALIEDLSELVAACGPRVILGGLSLGAKLALDYALARPEQVRALVLASYPSSGEETKRHAWALGFAEAIEQRGLDVAGAEFVWAERSRFDARGAALIRQGFLEHAPHALAQILTTDPGYVGLAANVGGRAPSIDHPNLHRGGKADLESLEPCRELAALLPQAELHELAGAGHVVNLEQPAAFNRILNDFLEPFRAFT